MIFAEMLYRFKLTHINLPEGHQGLAEVSLLKNGGWFEGYAGLIGGSDRARSASPPSPRFLFTPPLPPPSHGDPFEGVARHVGS